MSQELIFASNKQALQYLSDYTGNKIIIAKSMEQLMPELKERFKSRIHENKSDEEIEKIIIEIAKVDSKFDGNLKRSAKSINTLLDWYLKNPTLMERSIKDPDFSEDIKRFNTYRGQNKIDKKLNDFKDPKEFIHYLSVVDIEEKEAKTKDVKAQFLANPKLEMDGFKVYYVDEEWDELGQALFEGQTKWCVNEESSYDGYTPLWLFTTNDGSYHALFGPGDDMFNNNTNEPLEPAESKELMPLLEELGLVDQWEQSNAGKEYDNQEPPYDEQPDYEYSAWDSWIDNDFISKLEDSYEDEIEEYREDFGEDAIKDVSDLDNKELYTLFQDTAHNEDIFWDWEKNMMGLGV